MGLLGNAFVFWIVLSSTGADHVASTESANIPNVTTPVPEGEGSVSGSSTDIPIAEPEGWTIHFNGSLPNSTANMTVTPQYNITSAPDDSPVKNALMAISKIKNGIASSIYRFFYYSFDNPSMTSIIDGGFDMYDIGNQIEFFVGSRNMGLLKYDHYYSDPDNFEIGSTTGHPFTALMYIKNKYRNQSSYSIEVRSDTGADGSGRILYFNGSASALGIHVVYAVTTVFGAGDPSICEVYMAISKSMEILDDVEFIRNSKGSNDIRSGLRIRNYPRNVSLGFMLLSRSSGEMISQWEVNSAVSQFASAVYNTSEIPFNFTVSPISSHPATTAAPTTSYSTNAQISDTCPLKNVSERLSSVQGSIVSSISYFYRYLYDAPRHMTYISDGGGDMYDGGNRLSILLSRNVSKTNIRYNTCFSKPGSYDFFSITGWPFIALMYINNSNAEQESFYMRVTGNAGADGQGSLIYFQGSASGYGIQVVYAVTQVYSAGDPSICEVYFAMSNQNRSGNISDYFDIKRSSSGTNNLDSSVGLTNFPQRVWTGYMLLSKSSGIRVLKYDVDNALSKIARTVFELESTVYFNFIETPIITVSTTTATPTTTSIDTQIPDACPLKNVSERIAFAQRSIVSSIGRFYQYRYDDSSMKSIRDGGSDMYDYGNMVYINSSRNASGSNIRYNTCYSKPGSYDFFSITGWPFVALMHINNSNAEQESFYIRVTGNAGADHGGSLIHFQSFASGHGISVAYTVTHVYSAGDPSICEVYFAFSYQNRSGNISDHFDIKRNSLNTDNLNSSVGLINSPKNAWLGYMLLSKRYGTRVSTYEVENALNIIIRYVLGLSYPVNFYYPTYPTAGPVTTTAAPRKYYAYDGFRQTSCGRDQYSYSRTRRCGIGERPARISLAVDLDTFGYPHPVEGFISTCVDSSSCYSSCSNISDIIGDDVKVLYCYQSCCSYDYCNSPYYYYNNYHYYPYTPPYYGQPTSSYGGNNASDFNVTLPESALADLKVEILPNCELKSLFARIRQCSTQVFNSWPFFSPATCKSTVTSSLRCALDSLSSCSTNKLFSSAMFRVPGLGNLTDLIVSGLSETNILDIICDDEAKSLHNATLKVMSPFNYSYETPLIPGQVIGFGLPYCDRFIFDSLLEWGAEYFSVLKTSNDRTEMCRSLNGVLAKVLHAAENRCNFDAIAASFSCDSVLRNQVRALIVQAKMLLPRFAPDYCQGVEPAPVRPVTPPDIPFLPSCTLKQTIKSVWSCEDIFSKQAPYSESDACMTNMNRFMQCVANQLEDCHHGTGINVLSTVIPYIQIQDITRAIRYFAQPPTCADHGRMNYIKKSFCSSAMMDIHPLNHTLGNILGLCQPGYIRRASVDILNAYFRYAGARNTADVCMVFRSVRDTIRKTLTQGCDLALLRFLLPFGHDARNIVTSAVNIALETISALDISSCPKTRTESNSTANVTTWLRAYSKWRLQSMSNWQAKFEKWRQGPGNGIVSKPDCIDLTEVTCLNPSMKGCEPDYYGCKFCYCLDGKYRLSSQQHLFDKWNEDYKNWEKMESIWTAATTDKENSC